MLDHIGIKVSDMEESRAFYENALAPLGYKVMMSFPMAIGLGADGKPDFWLSPGEAGSRTHIAFTAKDRKTVDAFYEAALEAGGKDNGPPGVRPHYHQNYYGAFVFDLDNNNIEAVCHHPQATTVTATTTKPKAKSATKTNAKSERGLETKRHLKPAPKTQAITKTTTKTKKSNSQPKSTNKTQAAAEPKTKALPQPKSAPKTAKSGNSAPAAKSAPKVAAAAEKPAKSKSKR